MAELRCEGLAKSYGTRSVLADLDLVVPAGTMTAILGASGSGKTTLLRLIIGFIPVDGGVVTVGGSVVAEAGRVHVPAEKRAIGYVAQEGALFPHLTVAENVAFGLPRPERKSTSRVGDVLDLVGLDRDYASRNPHELSGGEQRRVALARALAPRPRVVLLDEPFSGLDAALRAETREAVLDALAREETTAVLVTHDQAEALSTGREVALLREGRLVQTATPSTLYGAPVDLDVARFVGDAVVVPGHAGAGLVECALGRLEVWGSAVEGPVQVMIRPEQIRLVSGSPLRTRPAEGGVAAEVVGHVYYGPDTVVRLVLRDGSGTLIVSKTFDRDVPRAGALVNIVVSGPVTVYSPHVPADGSSTARRLGGSEPDAEVTVQ
jgi:iron(III) transport system ATP-binding protein